MSLTATISYWPNKNFNFGHVSIEVQGYDEQEKRVKTFYVSWARGNKPDYDVKYHGRNPLKITLPLNQTKIKDFEQNFKASPYYLSDDLIKFAHEERTTLPIKKIKEKLAQYAQYCSPYSYATNNCAHAVLEVLHYAGYLKAAPSHISRLKPYTLAEDVVRIGLEQYKKNIELAKEMKAPEKFDRLYKELITALEGYKFFKLKNRIFTSTSYIDAAIKNLGEMRYANETEFLQEIIKVAASYPQPAVKEIFHVLIDSFPDKLKYHVAIQLTVDELKIKEKELKGAELTELQDTRSTLEQFLVDSPKSKEQAKNNPLVTIKKAKTLLERSSLMSKIVEFCVSILSRISVSKTEHFSLFNAKKRKSLEILTDSIEKKPKVA